MPYFKLVPHSVSLLLGGGDPNQSFVLEESPPLKDLKFNKTFSSSLQYSVHPESILQNYRLSSGEDFRELEATISIKPLQPDDDPGELRDNIQYFGPIKSSDGFAKMGSAFIAQCYIPQNQFDELVAAARLGRMPELIALNAVGPGIEYGWEPDGSGLEWDNENHKLLAVSNLSMALPYISLADPDAFEEKVAELPIAPTKGQIDILIKRIEEFKTYLGWFIAIGVFIAIVSLK